MATITGQVVFDNDRNGQFDIATDVGIGNVPIVLQNTVSNDRLGVMTLTSPTTAIGNFSFINVPNGQYRLILVDGYTGNTEQGIGDFDLADVGETPEAKLPDYTVIPTNSRLAGMNALNAVSPTIFEVTVNGNDVDNQNFYIGPAIYEQIEIDSQLQVTANNLITSDDNDTLATEPTGTEESRCPATNPYANDLTSELTDFTPTTSVNSTSTPVELNVIEPKLDISITHGQVSDLKLGDTIDYMLTITNSGVTDINNISIIDDIPPQYLEIAQVTVNDNPVTTTNQIIVDNIAPDNTANVVISLKVIETGLTNFKNTLDISGQVVPSSSLTPVIITKTATDNEAINIPAVAPPPDPDPTSTPTRIAYPADSPNKISVSITADQTTVYVGDIVTYNILVQNIGSVNVGTVSNPVILYDYLPQSLSLIPQSIFIDNMQMPYINLYGINLGILAPGSMITISFDARVSTSRFGPIYNMAKVFYGYIPEGFAHTNTYSVNSNVTLTYIY